MSFVIDPKPQKDAVKEVIHKAGCGALIGYVANDVIKDIYTDYLGDKEYYYYIMCPNCGGKLRVKG